MPAREGDLEAAAIPRMLKRQPLAAMADVGLLFCCLKSALGWGARRRGIQVLDFWVEISPRIPYSSHWPSQSQESSPHHASAICAGLNTGSRQLEAGNTLAIPQPREWSELKDIRHVKWTTI